MKLKTNFFIPEERFARRFAKELILKLKTEMTLGTKSFEVTVISEHPHWTGGKGYGNQSEFAMARKITLQLVRYYDFPYQVKYSKHVTDGIEFSKDGRFLQEFPF